MHLLFALVLLLAGSGPAQTASGRTEPSPQAAAIAKKVVGHLEEAGFNYRKTSEGVWVVSFRGDNTTSIEVVVHAQEKMVVILSTVKKKISAGEAQLRQFLEANYKANFAKLAIDEDGDLLALTELPPDVTASGLRNAVDEVASLTDTAVGLLSAGMTSTASRASTEAIESVRAATGATLSILRGTFELSYDPKKWKPAQTTDPGVTQLNHVSGDAYLKVISERLEVKPETLAEIALGNARQAAPDMTIETETPHISNGLKLLILRYSGTASGIRFTFFNQMYSDSAGTVQLAAWTGTNLFKEYRRDFLELFAGLRKVN